MSVGRAIGIVGGTFDPIHAGHLSMARGAQRQLGLELVLLIPAGIPWQRAPKASAQDRLAMACLAVGSDASLRVDDREVRRNRPSYTLDTLLELRAEWGLEHPLWLVLGADAFLNLPTWHRWSELFEQAHIAVACRPGYAFQEKDMDAVLKNEVDRRLQPLSAVQGPAGAIVLLDTPLLDISSTGIRQALHSHRPVGDLLPAAVLDYIESHHLYS